MTGGRVREVSEWSEVDEKERNKNWRKVSE